VRFEDAVIAQKLIDKTMLAKGIQKKKN